jgi:hypothetical protein
MGKENGKGIVEWLATKLGLYNERIDIHKELMINMQPLLNVKQCGERKNHNGFKYEICTNGKITIRVLELYFFVY